MLENVQGDLLLCADSRFDESKNKVILKVTINCIFSRSLSDQCIIIESCYQIIPTTMLF